MCNLGDPTKRTLLAALLTPSASHPRDLAVFARRGRRLASQRDAPGSTHSQRHDGGSAVVACAVCVVGVCARVGSAGLGIPSSSSELQQELR